MSVVESIFDQYPVSNIQKLQPHHELENYKEKTCNRQNTSVSLYRMEIEKKEIRTIPSLLNFEIVQMEVEAEKHYWNFCANCGTLLDSRKCKLFCPKCGFYHNCSEP